MTRQSVCVAYDAATADAFVQTHFARRPLVLGVDTEWRPCLTAGQSSPTALIQVASEDHALLVHLSTIGFVPASVDRLLNDPQVYMVAPSLHTSRAADAQRYVSRPGLCLGAG